MMLPSESRSADGVAVSVWDWGSVGGEALAGALGAGAGDTFRSSSSSSDFVRLPLAEERLADQLARARLVKREKNPMGQPLSRIRL